MNYMYQPTTTYARVLARVLQNVDINRHLIGHKACGINGIQFKAITAIEP
jgi:hypothetical protein